MNIYLILINYTFIDVITSTRSLIDAFKETIWAFKKFVDNLFSSKQVDWNWIKMKKRTSSVDFKGDEALSLVFKRLDGKGREFVRRFFCLSDSAHLMRTMDRKLKARTK